MTRFSASAGMTHLTGGTGNDRLGGGDGNDDLSGGDDDDFLWGDVEPFGPDGTGDDTLEGGSGSDRLYGYSGDDVLTDSGTDNSYDFMDGGAGNDILSDAAGPAELRGSADNDTLIGGDGNDTLAGETGNDSINGGAGADTIYYRVVSSPPLSSSDGHFFYSDVGDGIDTIDGGTDHDTLSIFGSPAIFYLGTPIGGNNYLTTVVVNGTITSIAGGTVANVESVMLDLGEQYDTLDYTGTTEAVTVDLATGTATGFTSIAGVENVFGGEGDDALTGDAGANSLAGGAGDDRLEGGAGDDMLDGGIGEDTAVVSANRDAVTVTRQEGRVVLDGPDGHDVLSNIERIQFADALLLVGVDEPPNDITVVGGGSLAANEFVCQRHARRHRCRPGSGRRGDHLFTGR